MADTPSSREALRGIGRRVGVRNRLMLLVSCALALLLASSLAACSSAAKSDRGPTDAKPPKRLYPGEVRQYQGAKLSSIEDFYENSIKGPQQIDPKTYRLEVNGLVKTPLRLTYDQVLARQTYDKVVRLNCVEGWSVDIWWEGVRVADLLDQAGVDANAKVVIFRAADGYSSSLPLSYIRNQDILLASKMNGVVMPPERGFPFMLVAEDRWGYKWVKWVKAIEVSNDASFKGYWERRGYSNGGELDKKFTD